MGGSKCSYRNCTVKSDGRTHLFHFPVFDKVRCNKWLKNAQRDDYLNLKVTQLRNRVICQHHFKDDQFMNFKKDKLKFDAVPTENGPFCSQEKSSNAYHSNNPEISTYPITLEDIESDSYTVDKRAVPNGMKYWDFLTNGELSDLDCFNPTINLKEEDYNDFKNEIQPDKTISKLYVPPKAKVKHQNTPTQVVQPYSELDQLNNQDMSSIIVENVPIFFEPLQSVQSHNAELNQTPVTTYSPKLRKHKVTILSEKKISEPLKLVGKFEPVSPNLVLPVRKKEEEDKKEPTLVNNCFNFDQNQNPPTIFNDSLNHAIDRGIAQQEARRQSLLKNRLSPKKTSASLKHKLTLQRAADIEKKRKFNMKLRDVLHEGLETLEKRELITVQKTPAEPQPEQVEEKNVHERKLYTDDNINSQKDMFVILQEQIRQLQEALMVKIDNNSKIISDLQKTAVMPKKVFTVSTQTQVNEESRKKELFRELAQFLSPETKNAVYEELFINKYERKSYLKYSPPKRKKHR